MGDQKQGKKKKGDPGVELARRELTLAREDLEQATRRATSDAQLFSSTLHDLMRAVEGAANTSLVALANSTEKFHAQLEVARREVDDARGQLDALRREMDDVRAMARAQLDAAERDVTAARAGAIEHAESSVHEIERQARAALHRSTERIGVMLAQAEDEVVEARGRIVDETVDDPIDETLDTPEFDDTDTPEFDDTDTAELVEVDTSTAEPVEDDTSTAEPVDATLVAPIDVAFDESFESPFTAPSDPEFDAIFDTAPDEPETALVDAAPVEAADPFDVADPVDCADDQAVFDRLVAEFRSSPFDAPADALADEPGALTEPWPAGPAPSSDPLPVAGPDEITENFAPSPVRNGRAVDDGRESELFDVGPVYLTVPVDTLDLALEALTRREARFVRVAMVPVDDGDRVRRVVRLSSFDGHGRWDVHEIRVRSRGTTETAAVVAFPEFAAAIEAAQRYAVITEATMVIEGGLRPVVTVEGHDLRCEPDAWSPSPPLFGRPLERVDLAGLPGPSAVLASRLGRLAVPPPLVAHLRTLEADEGLILDVDGMPMLQVSGPESPDRLRGDLRGGAVPDRRQHPGHRARPSPSAGSRGRRAGRRAGRVHPGVRARDDPRDRHRLRTPSRRRPPVAPGVDDRSDPADGARPVARGRGLEPVDRRGHVRPRRLRPVARGARRARRQPDDARAPARAARG